MADIGGAQLGYRPLAAAFAIGLTAWRAGQDVQSAVELAGFSSRIAQATANRIRNFSFQPLTTTTQDTTLPDSSNEMSANKRVRSSSALTSTSSSGRRSTIPVAPSVKRYVKQCMQRMVEKKFLVGAISVTNVAATGTLNNWGVFNITQGTTDATRVGNLIHVKRLKAHFTFTDNVFGGVRALLVWDRQPNGALPAVSDVVATADFNALFNTNNVIGHGGSRFEIIFDKTGFIVPAVTTTNNRVQVTWTWYRKAQRSITFSGNAGTVADVTTNNLFWLFFSSSGAADIAGNLELEYVDN